VTGLGVETPAPVIDLDRLEANLAGWQAHCDRVGLRNRPHVKTHKCVEIARRQVALGAGGLTCQTLGEAEAMADAGLDDLLIPYNLIGESKLARLSALVARAEVTVSVDDERLLPGLDAAAARAGRGLRVLVDCDTGLGRTGVQSVAAATELARAVEGRDRLAFAGFLTYPAPAGASAFLEEAAAAATSEGLHAEIVSAGGTPGMWDAQRLLPSLTEYRVGTYAFHDRKTVAAGAAGLEDVAMTVLATVVSTPAPGRAVLDAGSKALTSDPGPEDGHGLVLEAPASRLARLDEEHGYLSLAHGERLELGQQVQVVPNHACVVSNLFERFVVRRSGELVDEWPIDARRR
jgi:D-serine deaminase-like pyridoxal phosphate-dependent protein